MLKKRANDGRFVPYSFTPGTGAGEWRPELPAFASDPFAWLSNVRPFTLKRASQFRTDGPLDMTSAQYATEFNEVKTLGALNGSTRTPEQTTAGACFVSTTRCRIMNRAFRQIAERRDLSLAREARLFGMASPRRGRRPDRLLGRQGLLELLAADHRDPRSGVRRQSGDGTAGRLAVVAPDAGLFRIIRPGTTATPPR